MRYIAAIWEQETGAGMGAFQEPEKGYPFHPSKGRPMGNRAEPLKGDRSKLATTSEQLEPTGAPNRRGALAAPADPKKAHSHG
jgi:hypothetical protein